MRIVVDMNLSPDWCPVLVAAGHEVVHWSRVGAPTAPDAEIAAWARERGYVIFTHDLDFGAMIAITGAVGPSIIQLRSEDVLPDKLAGLILGVLAQFQESLTLGALIVVEREKVRARVLPLVRDSRKTP